MEPVIERRLIKLRPQGGSKSAVLPKAWLDALGITDEVVAAKTGTSIVFESVQEAPPSIEDDPNFAVFLSLLAKDAFARLDDMGDMAMLIEGDDELLAGVSID